MRCIITQKSADLSALWVTVKEVPSYLLCHVVSPSCHFEYHQAHTFKNSTWCSRCVCVFCMAFRTNSDFYNITELTDWFRVTGVDSVHCAVRTESLYRTTVFVFRGLNADKYDMRSRTGFIWHRIGTSGGVLCTVMNSQVRKERGSRGQLCDDQRLKEGPP